MKGPSGSVPVVLGVALVGAAAFGVFNYSRYRDARDMAEAQAELRDAEAAAAARDREADARAAARRQEEFDREVASLRSALAASRKAQDELADAHRAVRDGLGEVAKKVNGLNDQAVSLQVSRDTAQRRLDALDKRNGQLEAERLQLIADREKAESARIAAESDNKQLRERYEGKGKGAALVAAVEGVRGTVTGLDPTGGDLMTLSVGQDAGLTRGAELDVYRVGGRGVLLGTAVVAEVGQKSATARFKPAGGRRVAELSADERPKVGDVVSKVSAERPGGR
jgi:hypothetical protein